jgi:flagellar basal body-associated protein FliL
MDFSNRNVQPQSAAPGAQNTAAGNFNKKSKRGPGGDKGKLSRIITVTLVALVAILIAAVIAVIVTGGDNDKAENKYVDSSKLQAVFLNTGQVYFGHIKTLNNKYFVVTDIYYLQTASSDSNASNNANSNVTLVKLGCELHEPYDQMVINSDQVTFWENLQDNGQVAKAVSTFQKQNPNGQKCADQSSSASTNSSNNAQNASSNKSN